MRKALISGLILSLLFSLPISAHHKPTHPGKPTPTQPTPSITPAPTGYVTRAGQSLWLNGQPYKFVGLQSGIGTCGDSQNFEQNVSQMGQGVDAIRVWWFQNFATTNGVRNWSRLDGVLNSAKSRGIKLVVTLENVWPDCGSFRKTEGWFQSGYTTHRHTNWTVPYKQWVQEVVTRYKNEPTIIIWQLMNEAQADTNGTCSSTAWQSLERFTDDTAATIKAIDPNHLVNLGSIGDGNCGLANDQYKWVQDGPNIDILEIHQYSPNPYSGDQWNGTVKRITQARELNKPLFNGEDGIDVSAQASTLTQRASMFDNKFNVHLNTDGVDGELIWTWNNGRICDSTPGWDICPNDPVFGVLSKY